MDQREFASLGGKATLKKHGRKHYRAMRALSSSKGRPKSPDKDVQVESIKRRYAREAKRKAIAEAIAIGVLVCP